MWSGRRSRIRARGCRPKENAADIRGVLSYKGETFTSFVLKKFRRPKYPQALRNIVSEISFTKEQAAQIVRLAL
jgi:hypothetical protein